MHSSAAIESPRKSQFDEDEDAPAIGAADLPVRVLEWRQFELALKEIRPSASEDGTMPELRKVGLSSAMCPCRCCDQY